jgi:hypothetical protein
MTGVNHLKKAEQRLKTCEDHTFCRGSYDQRILRFPRRLIHRFSDITTNHQLSLLFEASYMLIKAIISFKTRRSISQKRLSPPRQCASAHRRCDNRNIEGTAMGSTATPTYSTDLLPRYFHVFDPLRGPKRKKDLELTMKLNFLCKHG